MLKIAVKSHKGTPLDTEVSSEFGAEGGTIGRSPDNTLLLPDPDRIISRVHARVIPRDGHVFIRDNGTTVPVVVNGRALGNGNEARLALGDEIRIAGYAMFVVHAEGPPHTNSAADETATMPALREGTMLSWSEGGVAAAEERIESFIVPSPPDEDPDLPAPAPSGPEATPAPASARELSGVAGAHHAAPAPAATGLPAPYAAHDSVDDLRDALLRGAGVPDLALAGGLTPEFMEQLGHVMRETVRGLLDLLVARATAKREVRADATIIVASDNNPLKFSPGVDAAITHLLVPKGQGFMPPLRAISDACESLRLHQQGFLAGMRAALAASLGRFDPAQLEARAPPASLADSLLPMNHKSKLWSMYEELYGQLSKEAEADFYKLFGQEFLRAYRARTQPDSPRDRPAADT